MKDKLAELIKSLWSRFGKFSFKPTNTTSPTPTPTASPAQTMMPTPTLMPSPTQSPTITPIPNMPQNPYRDLFEKYFKPEDVQKAENIAFKESSLQPRKIHINAPLWKGMDAPATREEWVELRRKYPSIDVGLFQINTADAMNKYLENNGLTYWELINNPESNIRVAADLLYGRIPYTSPGWQNWVANRDLNY